MTPEHLKLKQLTADMVKGVGGGDAAAGFCRVEKSMLSEYMSPNKPKCFVPIDVVFDLEQLSRDREGWPHLTSALCQAMGGTFVALPEAPATTSGIHLLLADLTKEFAEATSVVCTGLADGNFDAVDRRRSVTELDDVIRKAAEMRALLLAGE